MATYTSTCVHYQNDVTLPFFEYHYDDTISVEVGLFLGTVCIRDLHGVHEDIFMMGDDAEAFILAMEEYMDMDEQMPGDIAELIVATPYAENLWN